MNLYHCCKSANKNVMQDGLSKILTINWVSGSTDSKIIVRSTPTSCSLVLCYLQSSFSHNPTLSSDAFAWSNKHVWDISLPVDALMHTCYHCSNLQFSRLTNLIYTHGLVLSTLPDCSSTLYSNGLKFELSFFSWPPGDFLFLVLGVDSRLPDATLLGRLFSIVCFKGISAFVTSMDGSGAFCGWLPGSTIAARGSELGTTSTTLTLLGLLLVVSTLASPSFLWLWAESCWVLGPALADVWGLSDLGKSVFSGKFCVVASWWLSSVFGSAAWLKSTEPRCSCCLLSKFTSAGILSVLSIAMSVSVGIPALELLSSDIVDGDSSCAFLFCATGDAGRGIIVDCCASPLECVCPLAVLVGGTLDLESVLLAWDWPNVSKGCRPSADASPLVSKASGVWDRLSPVDRFSSRRGSRFEGWASLSGGTAGDSSKDSAFASCELMSVATSLVRLLGCVDSEAAEVVSDLIAPADSRPCLKFEDMLSVSLVLTLERPSCGSESPTFADSRGNCLADSFNDCEFCPASDSEVGSSFGNNALLLFCLHSALPI